MAIKKAYYYLFYKLYKFSEAAPSRWLSDWKAEFVIDILMLSLFSSLIPYYRVFRNPDSRVGDGNLLFYILLIISVTNYFIFHNKNQWKEIVNEFDKSPIKKNKIGGWVVFGVILLFVANFIFSFYLYYQTPS